jgi:hypothetical protein
MNPKQTPGPPMTHGNMRELCVQWLDVLSLRVEANPNMLFNYPIWWFN